MVGAKWSGEGSEISGVDIDGVLVISNEEVKESKATSTAE